MNNHYSNYKEFKTIKDAQLFQDKNYKNYCENLEQNQKELIGDFYTGYSYQAINNTLRNKYVGSKTQIAYYEDSSKIINDTILNAPKIPENIVVYRTVRNNSSYNIDNHIKDNIYEEFGF